MAGLDAVVVQACQRGRAGGSPTAVVDETGLTLTDDDRQAVVRAAGTSHAVYLTLTGARLRGRPVVDVRYATATGPLPTCGHGALAALAVLADRAGGDREVLLRTRAQTVLGHAASLGGGRWDVACSAGPVRRRAAGSDSVPILTALGVAPETAMRCWIAAPGAGAWRLLVAVPDRETLAALTPDTVGLRAACDRAGLIGCCVYTEPAEGRRLAARMFAPAIGVAEDRANVNATTCLAALLAGDGVTALTVDMGDALDAPSTITAAVTPGPAGPVIWVGGTAALS